MSRIPKELYIESFTFRYKGKKSVFKNIVYDIFNRDIEYMLFGSVWNDSRITFFHKHSGYRFIYDYDKLDGKYKFYFSEGVVYRPLRTFCGSSYNKSSKRLTKIMNDFNFKTDDVQWS